MEQRACIADYAISMFFYGSNRFHVKDYKNPLHLDVVDRCLRRMADKTISDEDPQVSIYHNQVVVDYLSRSQ